MGIRTCPKLVGLGIDSDGPRRRIRHVIRGQSWGRRDQVLENAVQAFGRRDQHQHTPACHVYGFHDFRRAFATVNAPRMKPEALQRLMRHKSYQTTQKFCLNPTNQIDEAVSEMPVPDTLKKDKAGQESLEDVAGDGST